MPSASEEIPSSTLRMEHMESQETISPVSNETEGK